MSPTPEEITRHHDSEPPEGSSPWVRPARPRRAIEVVEPDPAWPWAFGQLEERIRVALGATRAWPWVAALPRGLDTVLGQGGHALTPAQAQQLALARVLLLDPPMVVLDEATAEAGSSGARELEDAASAVTEGRTALVVAHRLTQARAADRVVVLDDGRVVEEGSHAELLAASPAYAHLVNAYETEGPAEVGADSGRTDGGDS